jgi:hypothetical protein
MIAPSFTDTGPLRKRRAGAALAAAPGNIALRSTSQHVAQLTPLGKHNRCRLSAVARRALFSAIAQEIARPLDLITAGTPSNSRLSIFKSALRAMAIVKRRAIRSRRCFKREAQPKSLSPNDRAQHPAR